VHQEDEIGAQQRCTHVLLSVHGACAAWCMAGGVGIPFRFKTLILFFFQIVNIF